MCIQGVFLGEMKISEHEDECCPICLDVLDKNGSATFKGHCGHAFHCTCLLSEFKYRNSWRCVRCTQEWCKGSFVFLHVESKAVDVIEPESLHPSVLKFCDSIVKTTFALNNAAFVSSVLLHGFNVNIRWKFTSDSCSMNDLERMVAFEMDPYFYIRIGGFISFTILAFVSKQSHIWLHPLYFFDAIYITFIRDVTSQKLSDRFVMITYVATILVCFALTQERAMTILEAGIVSFLFACGAMQVIVSQDESAVKPTSRMKLKRAILFCILKVMYCFNCLYSYYYSNICQGAIISGITLLVCVYSSQIVAATFRAIDCVLHTMYTCNRTMCIFVKKHSSNLSEVVRTIANTCRFKTRAFRNALIHHET